MKIARFVRDFCWGWRALPCRSPMRLFRFALNCQRNLKPIEGDSIVDMWGTLRHESP